MKPQTKRKVPATEPSRPRHQPAAHEPPLFQRPEPTTEEIVAFNRRLKLANENVAAARPIRSVSPRKWQEWQSAVSEKYALYKEGVTLHAQHFSRTVIPADVARYDWDFWRDMELLKGGDQAHLEQAVTFLEADPWFFGSGYAKEDIIPAINRLVVTSSFATRLQAVILNMVGRRNGREFRVYKQLACKVDAPELREQLARRVEQGDFDVRRRARWILEALAQKDTMEAAKRAQDKG